MRVSVAACAVGLLVVYALPVRAEVTLRVRAGRVDITASAAPLSEVLRRLGELTGMKVLYEGAEPRDLVTVSLPGRSPVEAVNDLLKERKLNYAMAVDANGGVTTLIIVTAVRPPATQETARASTPAAPSAPTAPVLRSLLDLLEQVGPPGNESLRAETGSDAPAPEVKADVPLPELLERMSQPAMESPVAIPEGSLLRLLLPPGQPLPVEPRASSATGDKPTTGAGAGPNALPADPAEPPPR